MHAMTIYHHPRCSKSRETLALLQEKGLEFTIVDYLKTPLNKDQLKELKAHFALKDFVRINEPVFKELGLSLENEEQILEAMIKEPVLMQRPIVTYKGKAIIGRPPEKLLELFSNSF